MEAIDWASCGILLQLQCVVQRYRDSTRTRDVAYCMFLREEGLMENSYGLQMYRLKDIVGLLMGEVREVLSSTSYTM